MARRPFRNCFKASIPTLLVFMLLGSLVFNRPNSAVPYTQPHNLLPSGGSHEKGFPEGANMKLQEAFYPFGAHYGLVFSNNIRRGGPPENSKILAERIPHARLRVMEGGGHQFLIEQPDDFNNAVLEFLLAFPKES